MKRNTKFVNLHKQRGIVGLVLVAITLIGAVIAAFAMMGRNSATGVADQTSKTNVSIMMKQAADYRAGFDRMLVNGAAASTITFNNTVGTGLFDPTPGAQYAILQNPPAGIVASGTTPTFTYTQLVNLPGIGASATADYVATVGRFDANPGHVRRQPRGMDYDTSGGRRQRSDSYHQLQRSTRRLH
jgi:hypothetical protein